MPDACARIAVDWCRRWCGGALIPLGLVGATLAAFFGVWGNGFIDYDDNTYVFRNPHVFGGISWGGVKWAFWGTYASNWHPLTWLSHQLDCQLYGLNPAGHHVTSLCFHVVNVVLLFLCLRRMTGTIWPSALVAALFAVHPLRVESVAWVAERKDVLSAFFFLLSLWAYSRYAQSKPGRETREPKPREASAPLVDRASSRDYGLALVFFALGLMSKPMLVTLPFVLLLLDYWPFHRVQAAFNRSSFSAIWLLVREKWPFFAVSFISCIITLSAQDEALSDVHAISPGDRIINAALAYLAYLWQTLWPTRLAVFYPFQLHMTTFIATCSISCLLLLTVAAVLLAKRWPFVFTGWFWFVGMLVPVIGIVQVGLQARADRYTYLPLIGIYIGVAWGIAVVSATWPRIKFPVAAAAIAASVALAVMTHKQVAVWRNTHTLFAHSASVISGNFVALTMLAKEDLERGRVPETIAQLELILRLAPKYPDAEYLMGAALQMQGRMQEAIPYLEAAVGPEVETPGKARLVLSYVDGGHLAEAEAILDSLLRANPGDANAWLMAAALLKERGRTMEAVTLFEKLIAHNPKFLLDNPTMNFELAELYSLQGSTLLAVPFYSRAIEISPQFTNALNNFAWILATDPDSQVRNGRKAVELAERACELTAWQQPLFIGTLAAAYAECGRFDEARKAAQRAGAKAQEAHLGAVAKKNAELLELYRQNKPYREKAG